MHVVGGGVGGGGVGSGVPGFTPEMAFIAGGRGLPNADFRKHIYCSWFKVHPMQATSSLHLVQHSVWREVDESDGR